jgi:hypothetical protein
MVMIPINRVLPLPQGNHVAKFGKDPIYRTKVIFCSVYWIFNKLGHMIPLWKGKNPIYFGVVRSKFKVTITINIIFGLPACHTQSHNMARLETGI